jgi:hypothetical protein
VSDQLALFQSSSPEPEGLRYAAGFISPAIEQKLISDSLHDLGGGARDRRALAFVAVLTPIPTFHLA